MNVPVPAGVLPVMGELRGQLLRELGELVEKRTGLEGELQAVDKEIDSKQRALQLLNATQGQWVEQERAQPDVKGGGPGASTQVRALPQVKGHQRPRVVHP
jgi:hypothetical protein